MKRLAILTLAVVVSFCFAATAFAGSIAPGESTTCNNATAITLSANGTSSAGDRTNANAVIWKSSNFTTIPITLGPGDQNALPGGSKQGPNVGLPDMSAMGKKSVTLKHQENFSRGDSIGDISGEVRITNTGTINIDVNCG